MTKAASRHVHALAFCLSVLLGYSCGDPVPLEERPCPCAVGYVCCQATMRCVQPGATCAVTPPDGAAGADGGGGVGGAGGQGGSGATGNGGDGGAAPADVAQVDSSGVNALTIDRWRTMSRQDAPSPRYEATAIWTGKEMIIWGGQDQVPLGTGSRYDPATDRWTAMATLGGPTARRAHSAVWTGKEMIIWGGYDSTNNCLNSGARYNPETDSWAPMARVPAVSARILHAAVWSGSQMVIWGGQSCPVLVTPDVDAGGSPDGGPPAQWVFSSPKDAHRYDPVTDTWTPVTTSGAPAPAEGATALWTGSELLLFGGVRDGRPPPVGPLGLYDPAADKWRGISSEGAPSDRTGHLGVWTGSEALILGGQVLFGSGLTSASGNGGFNPTSNSWRKLSTLDMPALDTPGRMAIFAHGAGTRGTGLMLVVGSAYQGGAYDPGSNQWWPVSMQGAPSFNHTLAVWTGKQLLMWGHLESGEAPWAGARYEP